MSPSSSFNEGLAADLRGQVMHVPNMMSMFSNWPQGTRNVHCDRLRKVVDEMLERAVLDVQRCQQFKRGDFGLFCSIWWPDATWDDLYLASLFTVWAFIWDDTIDTNEHILSDDFEKACAFRENSLTYVRYSLGLVDDILNEPPCPDVSSCLFKEFADGYCKRVGREQRQRFFEAVRVFFEHSEMEQAERLRGRLPDYDEYMSIRHGVTAVGIFVLLLEIPLQTRLPEWIKDSEEMKGVWRECNASIIIINDVLSLKKEIATDCVINAVPVLYRSGKSLDEAISQLMGEMVASRDRLDMLSRSLDGMTKDDPELNDHVMRYVNGCRRMDTGTIEYTTLVERYGVLKYLQEDGTLDITL